MEKIRLNKYIAECGVCSRRDADRMIDEGRVLVDGRLPQMGVKVDDNNEILVDGKKISHNKRTVVYAYYKPVGVTCTEKDEHAERKIFDEVKLDERVTYAGRLDKDSEGLLLLSNDGELINRLMKGANAHEKEYIVKVNREIDDRFVTSMAQGVYIKDLDVKTRQCEVEKLGKRTFRIVLTQGVNRQIRRMCRELNYRVTFLKRIRVANITLASLEKGEFREISGIELQELYNIAYNDR